MKLLMALMALLILNSCSKSGDGEDSHAQQEVSSLMVKTAESFPKIPELPEDLHRLLVEDFNRELREVKIAYSCKNLKLKQMLYEAKFLSSREDDGLSERLSLVIVADRLGTCLQSYKPTTQEEQVQIQDALKEVAKVAPKVEALNIDLFQKRERAVVKMLQEPIGCKISGKDLDCSPKTDYPLLKKQYMAFSTCRPFPRFCTSGTGFGSLYKMLEDQKYFLNGSTKDFNKKFLTKLYDNLEPFLCSKKKLAENLGIEISGSEQVFCFDIEYVNETLVSNLKKINEDRELLQALRLAHVNTFKGLGFMLTKSILYSRPQGEIKNSLNFEYLESETNFESIKASIVSGADPKRWEIIRINNQVIDENVAELRDIVGAELDLFNIDGISSSGQRIISSALRDQFKKRSSLCDRKLSNLRVSIFGNSDIDLHGRHLKERKLALTLSVPYSQNGLGDLDSDENIEYEKNFRRTLPLAISAFEKSLCHESCSSFNGRTDSILPQLADPTKVALVSERLKTEEGFKIVQEKSDQWQVTVKAKILYRSPTLHVPYILSGSGSLAYPMTFGNCRVMALGQFILQQSDEFLIENVLLQGECENELFELKNGRFTMSHGVVYSGTGTYMDPFLSLIL